VLDYVVVHELAHLAEFGHTAPFWRLVREVLPEADRARRWLREHARELRWTLE
jgi:predicted metal-dependent hydrolase